MSTNDPDRGSDRKLLELPEAKKSESAEDERQIRQEDVFNRRCVRIFARAGYDEGLAGMSLSATRYWRIIAGQPARAHFSE